MTDTIPTTELARSNDTVDLDASRWPYWVFGGMAAWALWRYFGGRRSGGLRGVGDDEDKLWSEFYQSEYHHYRTDGRGALVPPINPKLSAAEARAMLLAKFPRALDEPGIEDGSPVAPTKIYKPSIYRQKKMAAEGEEYLKEKKREYERIRRARDPEAARARDRERGRAWRAANSEEIKEKARERNRKWREQNPERARANRTKWQEANKGRHLQVAREYTQRMSQDPEWLERKRAQDREYRKAKYAAMSPEAKERYKKEQVERARQRRAAKKA